jgi:hypothetical protein
VDTLSGRGRKEHHTSVRRENYTMEIEKDRRAWLVEVREQAGIYDNMVS